MAQIKWTPRFLQLLNYYIGNACVEFGQSTAMRWAEEIAVFEDRVKLYPASYALESLLLGKKKLYRGCHLMNRRFKIIYYYDETEDVIYLVDIWDTRMNPKTLIRRIK
ncbi:MAG: type II toxin-antitoxin system RelE/ParE family toxin [Prevotella sp.]|nr:type II toxin-antitoxin system RelE/ParE family toxin [Prevotella sp.]